MEILIILILIGLNGVFALSEIAVVSVKKNKIEQKALKGNKNARIVLKLLEEPENFLSAVQVGITLVGIVSGAYSGVAFSDDLQPHIAGIPWVGDYAGSISIILIVGAVTYLSIVFGELIPKTLALKNAIPIALAVAPFVRAFSRLVFPVVKLLSVSTKGILMLFGVKKTTEEALSEEELRHMIRSAGKAGVIEKEESQMHQNIFFFTEVKARSLMTHRSSVEWINIEDPINEIGQQIADSAFSKFPACVGSPDNILGILTSKHFIRAVNQNKTDLRSVIEKPLIIPEVMLASDVLKLFRENQRYIALVVDEFGSFEGIITLHDLMESILGDLPGLGESEEEEFVKRNDGSYIVSGSITAFQLNSQLGQVIIEENSDSYSTLGGFVIFYLNKIPEVGEKFSYRNFNFEVLDLDGRRIDKVLIWKEKELHDFSD